MTDRPFVLLTQDDCPNCERLKKMLAGPLKGQFNDRIEVIHRRHRQDDFAALALAHHIQSAPALLRRDGKLLCNTGGLGEMKAFLLQEKF